MLVIAVWGRCQSEVDEATQCVVSSVAIVQTRHEGRGECYEESLATQIWESSHFFGYLLPTKHVFEKVTKCPH